MTRIEWATDTANPILGCSPVSPACANCYAARLAHRGLAAAHRGLTTMTDRGPAWTGEVRWSEPGFEALVRLSRARKPRRIFVGSMTDIFHEGVPDEWRDRIFGVIAMAPRHIFQVLTKRPERMLAYFKAQDVRERIGHEAFGFYEDSGISADSSLAAGILHGANCITGLHRSDAWPMPNVWLGTTVEDQQRADERIPILLDTPAAKRFVSVEPMLGAVNLRLATPCLRDCNEYQHAECPGTSGPCSRQWQLDWIIAGGETGPGARPSHPDWFRSLRDQCIEAGAPFFFKNWGEWSECHEQEAAEAGDAGDYLANNGKLLLTDPRLNVVPMRRVGKAKAGHLLDGREWREVPA